jgi:methyl-accepting chemotaxis protein
MIRQEIPEITKTVNDVNANIPMMVSEVKQTREAIPEILDRTEKIVGKAEKIGEKAGEEAVTGAIKGVIKAPGKALKKIGETVTPK